MSRKVKINLKISVILVITAFLLVNSTLSLIKHKTPSGGSLSLATWDVSLNPDADTSLTIVPEMHNDSYIVNITSNADVDIRYSIIISNLPAGVEVSLDSGSFRSQDANNTISFDNIGAILYSDGEKTKEHTLTFKANSSASAINNQTVNINIVAKQII